MPFRPSTADLDNPCGTKRFTENPERHKFVQGDPPLRGFSKNGTGNYPKCDTAVTVVAPAAAGLIIVNRALFLFFFFQRFMTGATIARSDINIGVETADHNLAERAMRLGLHGHPRWRGMFAAPWLGDARRRDVRDGFAFPHKVETDLLLAAG